MAETPERQRCLRFGAFELDVQSRELRRGRRRLRVADHSIRVLEALLEHPGELVTRHELRRRLWPADTFVDFEHGLNSAVRRLRAALGDSAGNSRFIETLPRSGYRFIAPVEVIPHSGIPATGLAPASRPAGSAAGTGEPATAHSPEPVTPASTGGKSAASRRWHAVATAASLGIATMVVGSLMPLPSGATGPRALTQTRLTFDDGLQAEPSLSSDGSLVAFTADRAGNFDIWSQRIAGGDAVRVTTDPAHDWQPQWSPDDQTIVFRSERGGGGLYVVPATGGFERQISDFGYRPTWSADGSRILFRSSLLWGGSRSTLFVVGLRGESARQVDMTRLAAGESIGAFGWTPDGRGVALLSGEGPDFALTLVTVDLADGTVHRWGVAAGVQHAVRQRQLSVARGELLAWDARENALYFVGVTDGTSEVWAFNLDATRRTVANGPFRLSAAAAAGNISLSSRGRRITFDNSQRTARIWLYPLGPNGRSLEDGGRPLTPAAMHAFAPDLAPDGAKMLFMWIHPGGSRQGEIVLRALADPDARTVSMHGVHRGHMSGMPFRWAPDGRRVAYMELSTGHLPGAGTAHVPSVSGAPQRTRAVAQTRLLDVVSGKDVPLTRPLQGLGGPSSWSPDGRYLITGSGAGRFVPGQHAIVLLPVAAAPEAERSAIVVTASAGHRLFQPNISPDGRWIAFVAAPMAAPHRTRIMVVRASGGTPSEWRALSDGPWDDKPRWAPDGRLLYFVSDRAGLNAWAVPVDGATGVACGAPFQVTHFRGPGTQILPDLHLMELGLGGGHLSLPVVTPHGGVWLLDAIDVLAPSHQFARTMR